MNSEATSVLMQVWKLARRPDGVAVTPAFVSAPTRLAILVLLTASWMGGTGCNEAPPQPFVPGSSPAASSPGPVADTGKPLPGAVTSATLPVDDAPFFPALTKIDGQVSGDDLARPDQCTECHVAIGQQWQSSAHRFASFNNPVYRVSVDTFRQESGKQSSRFCAGCHDPALLIDGAMDVPVDVSDPRSHAGISCRLCHGITDATSDGNGSYTLRSKLVVPQAGDPQSLAAHRASVTSPAIGSPAMCASCHRAFLSDATGHPHLLSGTDDYTPWQRSGYAKSSLTRIDSVTPKTCVDCHMPREAALGAEPAQENGTVRSHRFAGAHTYLAAMVDDPLQARAVEKMLNSAALIDVATVRYPARPNSSDHRPADGADFNAGEELHLDVVVTNQHVGHLFPGGTLDAQDTWVSVEVFDEDGQRVALSDDGEAAHRLRAEVVDENGHPLRAREITRFRATAYRNVITPRDSSVITYGLHLPSSIRANQPLKVRASLQHRSRPLALVEATCDAYRQTRLRDRPPLDPCIDQPVQTIARAEVWLGAGGPERAQDDLRDAERLLRHGRGLTHSVQERLSEAEQSLRAASALFASGTAKQKAAALHSLGVVLGRQGRTDEALSLFDEAQALIGPHGALSFGRGQALMQVWRFQEAIAHFEAAIEIAPNDDRGFIALAQAHGSLGHNETALAVAKRGLVLQPRSADLLRTQALALAHLLPGASITQASDEAYRRYRVADVIVGLGASCGDGSPHCARERTPVHLHDLTLDPLYQASAAGQ